VEETRRVEVGESEELLTYSLERVQGGQTRLGVDRGVESALYATNRLRMIEDAKPGVFFGCPVPWGLRLTASRRPLEAPGSAEAAQNQPSQL
jgi:hypothetical protein